MGGQARKPGWLATLLGVFVLVSVGFVFGLIAGLVSEEPELVIGHVQGRGESVSWIPGETGDYTVAAETAEPGSRALQDDGVAAHLPAVGSGGPPRGAAAGLGRADAQAAAPATRAPARGQPIARTTPTPSSASAAPPTDRTPAAAKASPGRYSVQVGAFADSHGADRVASLLGSKGYPVYVTPAATTGDGRWRVRVGPVEGRGQAEQVAQRLKHEEQLPTWVLPEGGS